MLFRNFSMQAYRHLQKSQVAKSNMIIRASSSLLTTTTTTNSSKVRAENVNRRHTKNEKVYHSTQSLSDDEDETRIDLNLSDNSTETVQDFTSNKAKSGTPSPWAVFDAWGAATTIETPLSADEESKLSSASVKIPMTEDEGASLPNESEILKAYDHLLKNKSSVHFGYPYNLMYDHGELYEFMKYSLNNLGDPYVTSNYGIHSRQFECSVIDFFAKLWKIPKDEYWGYVTTCGTEGNLHGMLLARECHPDGILYSSK